MKKFISVVLALTMVISMFATASAATMKETLVDTYGIPNTYVLSDELPISISAKRSGGSGYSASPLSIIDSNLSNGIGVDYKTTLDMSLIKALFDKDLIDVIINDPSASVEFYTGKVTTTVTVTITYPATAVADESALLSATTGTLDSATFVESEARTISPAGDRKIATIKYKNTDGLTVDNLDDNNYAALNDITFTLENAIKYNTSGDHVVTVTMEGETTITYGDDTPGNSNDDIAQVIKYKGATANYTVSINAPSTGGGSSYNTIKLVTNGGNELKNISVRRGNKAELPTPVREGYVFAGWYTDSALTNPFDTDTVINRNYTLYAKWVESGECEGTVEDNCPCLKYDDLDPTMWYHKGVDYVLNSGMMIGVDTTKFAPDWDVTRAMLVTVLWRAEGKPVAGNTTFTDLEDGLYYVDAVKWAAENGVVNGYSDTVFAPNDAITREQFAAIMYRYAKNKGYDVSVGENTNILSYSDYDAISEYAIEAMQYTLGSGLIKGRTETTLNPKDNTTRAEMATILYRFFTEIK